MVQHDKLFVKLQACCLNWFGIYSMCELFRRELMTFCPPYVIFLVALYRVLWCFLYTVWVKKSPVRFSDIFSKRLGIFNQFLHTYCTLLSTLNYKFLFCYLQLWRSYAILSETTHRICLLSKCRHCWRHVIANMFVDIIKAADLGWLTKLPQTTINKATNDFRKRLHACVLADGVHFEHIMWTR